MVARAVKSIYGQVSISVIESVAIVYVNGVKSNSALGQIGAVVKTVVMLLLRPVAVLAAYASNIVATARAENAAF